MFHEAIFPRQTHICSHSAPPLSPTPLPVFDPTSLPHTVAPSPSSLPSTTTSCPTSFVSLPHSPSPCSLSPTPRNRRRPTWLCGYITDCSLALLTHISQSSPAGSSPHTPTTFPYIIPPHFSPTYIHFLGQVSSLCDLISYSQASLLPEWHLAMQ